MNVFIVFCASKRRPTFLETPSPFIDVVRFLEEEIPLGGSSVRSHYIFLHHAGTANKSQMIYSIKFIPQGG